MAKIGRPSTGPKDRYLVSFWLSRQAERLYKEPIIHVYGPYTKKQAEYNKKKMSAEELPEPGWRYVKTCRPIDVDAMNASPEEEVSTMAKIAVSSRTKANFIDAAIAAKEGGKSKLSWPKLADTYNGRISELHALFSPVTELKGGWTIVDTNHVKKLEEALNVEAGSLLAKLTKGAKDPKDFAA